jgi:hypothetical protein
MPDAPELITWLGTAQPQPLSLTIALRRNWLPQPDIVELDVCFRRDGQRIAIAIAGGCIYPDQPVRLETVSVEKPWGREIWYSGIEARGESRVVATDGTRLPLSHYVASAPGLLTRDAPIVLLKVLDPRPEPVLGDLYFEVHEQKREVYVVTAVDPQAWPDGTGYIRYGMNQTIRAEYGNDEGFRSAYLDAVHAYERVRRAIDAGGEASMKRLLRAENEARAEMERFTALRALRVGDVVVVPTWLPHSLQHGVRVVEFQTPTYERLVVSFAQEVLTQNHWDSERAVAHMRLDAAPSPAFERTDAGLERIVSFPDFGVLRATLDAGRTVNLPASLPYAICCAVDAPVRVGSLLLQPEEACLVPHSAMIGCAITSDSSEPSESAEEEQATAHCLIAAPDL